jgi:hypothetical protein
VLAAAVPVVAAAAAVVAAAAVLAAILVGVADTTAAEKAAGTGVTTMGESRAAPISTAAARVSATSAAA